MRIIHFSDTHLGFSDFTKIDPEMGINLREADVYRAFSQVIDYISKKPPDFIVHSGDLFDTPRPSNRAINFALKGIGKISQKEIPLVVISGNHSTPRVKSSGSILEAFEIFDNIHPIYKSRYELKVLNNVAFHCIPHMASEEELKNAFANIRPEPKARYNVIVSHAGVSADVQYKMGEFNELMVPFKALAERKNFNYIALGHYHRHLSLSQNAYYSGSTERFSFREADQEKGFMDVDLDKGTFSFVPIKVREMAILPPIECRGRGAREIEDEVETLCKRGIKEKIVQITFNNVHRHQYVELNFQRLKEITAEAVHVKWVENWAVEKGKKSAGTSIGTLTAEFESFLEHQEIKDLDKKKLAKLGIDFLSAVEEPEEL